MQSQAKFGKTFIAFSKKRSDPEFAATSILHKISGTNKGIGAVIVKDMNHFAAPCIKGGGQEFGKRFRKQKTRLNIEGSAASLEDKSLVLNSV